MDYVKKLFVLFLLNFCVSKVACDKLVYVQAIWRHGDRSPEKLPYPTDIYTEDYWARGYGMLTNVGMNQLHELGTFFRQRYANSFVNETFDYQEVIYFARVLSIYDRVFRFSFDQRMLLEHL